MRPCKTASPWLRRIAIAAALSGVACVLSVQTATADEHLQRQHKRHHHYYHPRDVRPVYAPPVHYYDPPRPTYYAPSRPTYYAPPPVYAPPPGLTFSFPFR